MSSSPLAPCSPRRPRRRRRSPSRRRSSPGAGVTVQAGPEAPKGAAPAEIEDLRLAAGGGNDPFALERLGLGAVQANDLGKARIFFESAWKLGELPTAAYNLACVDAREKKIDAAFASLDRALGAGFDDVATLETDPDLGPLAVVAAVEGDPRPGGEEPRRGRRGRREGRDLRARREGRPVAILVLLHDAASSPMEVSAPFVAEAKRRGLFLAVPRGPGRSADRRFGWGSAERAAAAVDAAVAAAREARRRIRSSRSSSSASDAAAPRPLDDRGARSRRRPSRASARSAGRSTRGRASRRRACGASASSSESRATADPAAGAAPSAAASTPLRQMGFAPVVVGVARDGRCLSEGRRRRRVADALDGLGSARDADVAVDFYRHSLGDDEKKAVSRRPRLALSDDRTGASTSSRGRSRPTSASRPSSARRTRTAALHVAMLAAGVGPGDEVVTTPMTFLSSANCVLYAGGTPVFVDVDPATANIDPAAVEAADHAADEGDRRGRPLRPPRGPARRSGRSRTGTASSSSRTRRTASRGGATGYGPGQLADYGCFSFYATKNLTCGEGGAISARDGAKKSLLRQLSTHGMSRERGGPVRGEVPALGHGTARVQVQPLRRRRLDAPAAAPEARGAPRAARGDLPPVRGGLPRDVPGVSFPTVPEGAVSARHLFTIWVDPARRDAILAAIQARGVGVAVNYRAVHLTKYYVGTLRLPPRDVPERRADRRLDDHDPALARDDRRPGGRGDRRRPRGGRP